MLRPLVFLVLVCPVLASAQSGTNSYQSVWVERGNLPNRLTTSQLDSLRSHLARGYEAEEGENLAWGTFQVVRGADLNVDGLPDALLFVTENQRGTADVAVYLGASDGSWSLSGRDRLVVDSLALCTSAGTIRLTGTYQNGLRPYPLAWEFERGALAAVGVVEDAPADCAYVEWPYSHPYAF